MKEGICSNELSETKIALKELNVSIHKGSLIAVIGKVGSGKSSFIQAIAQNMIIIKNNDSLIEINGKIAYCSQEA